MNTVTEVPISEIKNRRPDGAGSVQVQLDPTVQIGTAGTREPTALKLEPGATTTLFVEWRPDAAGKQLEVSYGTLDEQGKPTDTQHLQMAVPIQAVSALRITSDKAPTGADFYVTNLQISPR